MQIQQPEVKNKILLRSFNEIQIEPTAINSIFFCQEDNNLYVARQKSTDVYHVLQKSGHQLQFQHIARLPWSKYPLKINQTLFLFSPFQLRTFSNNSWDIHPFTTELLSVKVRKISPSTTLVYSFHEQQTIEYKLSTIEDQEQFEMNLLSKGKTPFHITRQNIVEGYGKKIGPNNKSTIFTVCQFKHQDYIVIGDSEGSLNIYDFKTLGHLKSFKKHQGPILTIKIDEKSDSVFFSGSDSKIAAIRRIHGVWSLSGQLRGQSHDIFTLELVKQTLVSGGLTTDICCYPLCNTKQILQSYQNKVSYRSQSVVHSMKNYLLINKVTSFQLWKIREIEGDLQFLVRYQMPSQKFIKDIKISKRLNDKTHLIIVSTEIDTIGWKFSEITGLVKIFTIKNCYQFIQFLPGKNIFVGLRDTGDIEKVHCKTGKIDEIVNSQVALPTDMKLLPDQKLVIGSNLTHQIKVFDLKKKAMLSKCSLSRIYQVLCEKNQNEFLIKYIEDRKLYACNFGKKLIQQSQVFELPQNSGDCRYGGVIVHESQVTKNMKKYWYFANQNKVLLVNNLNNSNKKKVVRSVYTRQIGTILKPKVNKSFQLGIVHFNFKRMINNMEVKPLVAKKIA